jgi:thioredoxin-like negative regulator of GroEL
MGILDKLFGARERERERVVPDHVGTLEDFERVVKQAGGPAVLYVWGDACGPCKRMSHEVVAAATKHAGRVRFAELSTSGDRALLAALEIRATPTLIVYDAGEELGRQTGFRPASWFDEMVAAEVPEPG